jgi:hypothetical protein
MFPAETVKALRAGQYTSIAFDGRWHDGQPAGSEIVAYRSRDDDRDDRVLVAAAPSWIEFGVGLPAHDHVRAWALLLWPQQHVLWQTFLHYLRPGDEVLIVWSANGQRNAHLVKANLNIDTCELEIRRRQKRLRFHITTVVTPSDTARIFTAGARALDPIIDPPEGS